MKSLKKLHKNKELKRLNEKLAEDNFKLICENHRLNRKINNLQDGRAIRDQSELILYGA